MSEILVNGMEMPKDCYDCPLIIENKEKNGFYDCILIGKACALGAVHKDCPLVEVPPHGRLIDADKLKAQLTKCNYPEERSWYFAEACQFIDEAQTVLEATE